MPEQWIALRIEADCDCTVCSLNNLCLTIWHDRNSTWLKIHSKSESHLWRSHGIVKMQLRFVVCRVYSRRSPYRQSHTAQPNWTSIKRIRIIEAHTPHCSRVTQDKRETQRISQCRRHLSSHDRSYLLEANDIRADFLCCFIFFGVTLFFSSSREKVGRFSLKHTGKKYEPICAQLSTLFVCIFAHLTVSSSARVDFFICWFRKKIHTRYAEVFFRKSMQNTTQNKQHRVIVAALVKKIVVSLFEQKMKNIMAKWKKIFSTPIQLFRGSQWTRAREKCGIGYGGSAHISFKKI